jgi:hypothetical protein
VAADFSVASVPSVQGRERAAIYGRVQSRPPLEAGFSPSPKGRNYFPTPYAALKSRSSTVLFQASRQSPVLVTELKSAKKNINHRGHRGQKLQAAFLELLLPSQYARLVSLFFGLRNHSFFLIEDRKAGMSQGVIGIDFRHLLRDGNSLV